MNRFTDIDLTSERLNIVDGYLNEKLVSLEEALGPIQREIRELPVHIQTAKKKCLFPSEHGLTRDESASIYIYTMEWKDNPLYRILNIALRSADHEALKIWFPYLKLFDTALDKLPRAQKLVFRGIPFEIPENYTKDKIITWRGVSSCSITLSVIKQFIGDNKSTLFVIETINGRRVSDYTQYENEDEVILRMDTRLRVCSEKLNQTDGSYVVHLMEIDDDNNDESSNKGAYESTFKSNIHCTTKWIQNGVSVAGGNGAGNRRDQLKNPTGVYIDDDQNIYVVDVGNHRIVKWGCDASNIQIVAGGNASGSNTNQLKAPSDIIIDKERNALIICDEGNRRVIRYSNENNTRGEIIISSIDCCRLAMDSDGCLYVSDYKNDVVRRWKIDDTCGITVAGGNKKGSLNNQLDDPIDIFVDRDHSVYVSDRDNHRVMKWIKGESQGIVVAGGHGKGDHLTQLFRPYGVFVDDVGTVYVADSENHRIMRWIKGAKQGNIVVGGNGKGERPNQLNYPFGLSFDRQGNLYVVDQKNYRVQRFDIDQRRNK